MTTLLVTKMASRYYRKACRPKQIPCRQARRNCWGRSRAAAGPASHVGRALRAERRGPRGLCDLATTGVPLPITSSRTNHTSWSTASV